MKKSFKTKIKRISKTKILVFSFLAFFIFFVVSGFFEINFHRNGQVGFDDARGRFSYFSSFSGTEEWQDGVSLSACTATTGLCGTASGQTFSSPPTTNLCISGYYPSAVTTNATTYNWYCNQYSPTTGLVAPICGADNYQACSANRYVPPAPATLTATCSSTGLVSTSWSSVSGATYALRIDTDWSVPHLLQLDSLTSTSRTYQGTVGTTYNVWVHAIVGGVWSNAISRSVTCPITYSCTGTRPANTSIHSGDTTSLTTNTAWTYSATNTTPKCQYYCNSGYVWNGSSCVVPTYSCTGTRPANTSIHSGDTTSLTANTPWTYSATNTSPKCQYYCNSGYVWNGSSCVLPAVNGSCGTNATNYSYSATSYPSTTNTAFCSTGTPSPIASSIAFPAQGSSQTWQCTGSNGGTTATCLASRDAAPAPANISPQAVINTPATNQTITAGNSVSFSGSGTDSDGTIVAYEWRQSNCSTGTLLSTGSSFSRSFTTAGTYTIYFRVQDDDGAWSTNCPSRTITVQSPTYSCTGTRPANTSIHSGDTTSLTANTPWTYSATNTSPKCQYYCNSGYTWNGSLCRLNAACGSANGGSYCNAPPTEDLCAVGSSSTVTSTGGNWIWTCSSVSGATQDDASCSATIQTTDCGSPGNWREVNP